MDNIHNSLIDPYITVIQAVTIVVMEQYDLCTGVLSYRTGTMSCSYLLKTIGFTALRFYSILLGIRRTRKLNGQY